MKNKYKAIIFVFALLLAGTMLFAWGITRCSNEITGSLGEFPSKDAAFRASIRELKDEVQRCPKSETYRFIWTVKDDPMRQATLYYRAKDGKAYIGHEQDAFSGFSERSYAVDDAAIKEVVERGGTLEDFLGYDQNRK